MAKLEEQDGEIDGSRLRYAYLLADGRNTSPSYHQGFIYDGIIDRHGLSFDFYPLLPGALAMLWQKVAGGRTIFTRLIRYPIRHVLIPLWRYAQIRGVLRKDYDGILMGRCLTEPYQDPWLEEMVGKVAKRKGIPFVLYLSDAMHVSFPKPYERRFAAVSHVVAVTPWLVEEMERIGKPHFMSRVTLDVRRYPEKAKKDDGRIVIGFSGGPANFAAFENLEGALRRVLERHPEVVLKVVSNRMPEFASALPRAEFQPWISQDPYRGKYELGVEEMLDFDIALAPLLMNDYAKGKDSAKLRQYMALGLAIVGTRIGVNEEMLEDGVSGRLAVDEAEWEEAIEAMIGDAEGRMEMGRSARAHVEENFDVRVQAVGLAGELTRAVADGRHQDQSAER